MVKQLDLFSDVIFTKKVEGGTHTVVQYHLGEKYAGYLRKGIADISWMVVRTEGKTKVFLTFEGADRFMRESIRNGSALHG